MKRVIGLGSSIETGIVSSLVAKTQSKNGRVMSRESLVVATLVELADNLVDNFDVIDILTLLCDRCVDAVDVAAAGVMLRAPSGELQYVASSSDSVRILELFQIQAGEGPCVECVRSGLPVINHELKDNNDRWPRFSPRAMDLGFYSVHCLPMRLRGKTIGALNLFRTETGLLNDDDVTLTQGLADVATIAILQHQTIQNASILNSQLTVALNSRIVIEQSKGMIAQSLNCDMDHAFARLRAHARNHNIGLTDLAITVVNGAFSPKDLDAPKDPKGK
jgi:GAF domain-containing protein